MRLVLLVGAVVMEIRWRSERIDMNLEMSSHVIR